MRITEILDTIFPILRKSTSLIDTNYVIMHHILLPNCLWCMVKFVPGGHATFFCLCNSLVQVFLHVVHLLSSLKMKFHQPIKKYFIHISIVSRFSFLPFSKPMFPLFLKLSESKALDENGPYINTRQTKIRNVCLSFTKLPRNVCLINMHILMY